MNKIPIWMIVCVLLVVNALSLTGPLESSGKIIVKDANSWLPRCIKENYLDIKNNYTTRTDKGNLEPTQLGYNEDIVSLIQGIDESMMVGYLENLTSFGPRVTATSACDEAGKYIYNEFKDMGLDVRYHNWSMDDEIYGSNIEATIHGFDEKSNEIYVICAHYDSVPGSPGADDDGSGTAAVMAAAKVMSQYVFNNTVHFVTFSGEEQGLVGSYFYAEESNESNDNIIAVLNVDMIGFAKTEEDTIKIKVYEDEYSTWITGLTSDISKQYYPYCELDVIPSGYSSGSDHYYFWEFGFNAIFYAEYHFNEYYHSPEDTIEHMNISYAVKSTKLIVATLAELSEPVDAPSKPARPSGSSRGKSGEEYTYTSVTIDPQDNQIFYMFDWGDGTDSGWLGPYNSGDGCSASHIWDRIGIYKVKVKAKDTNENESPWSDPAIVSMPKNKTIAINPLILQFLENHSHLFPILRQILFFLG